MWKHCEMDKELVLILDKCLHYMELFSEFLKAF
jgi:hypothetical protein